MTKFQPETIHQDLGADFFDPVAPADFPKTILRYRNDRAAASVGLDGLTDGEWVQHFGRFTPLAGSLPKPLALRYHGHQFRSYNPDLGDGRGFLFAQMRDESGRLLDLGTKGSGQTPWSRQGDGRLTLKGGVREILATEMLEALGVNTSKTFSLIETGEQLMRGDEPSPTRSAVMVRLSHSHIRIGTFQRQAALKQPENIACLIKHSLRHYYPDLWPSLEMAPTQDRALALLEAVSDQVAETGAAWTAAGFVHGVLNTDNINITGESFDYGPWRFLPTYDPSFTAAYFDQTGLYAFGRQPETLLWNLARFAETLLDFADAKNLETALDRFWPAFQSALGRAICARLAVKTDQDDVRMELVRALIGFLDATNIPYEQAIFDLRGGLLAPKRRDNSPNSDCYEDESFTGLASLLESQFGVTESANLDHGYFQRSTPRTMLIDEVEAIWAPIADADDWGLYQQTLSEIAEMRDAYDGDQRRAA